MTATDSQTTTTTAMMTSTHNTDTNIAQRKRAPEQEERLRDCWSYHVNGAIIRRMKRNVLAANALFGTPEWVDPDMRWFMASEEQEVTHHAALAEKCLDEARAHAKRKGWRATPLEFLPRGILESEALEPYLKRWKRDDAAAAAAAAATPTQARCAYPMMD
jgi:hypothetical protein